MHTTFGLRTTLLAAGMAAWLGCSHATNSAQQSPPATPNAQQEGPRRDRGGRGMMMLFNGIQLSDSQRSQIDSIRSTYRDSLEALRSSGGGQSGDRSQFRDLMQRQFSAIRAVLTPDQQSTFDRNVEEMRARRGRRGAGPGTR